MSKLLTIEIRERLPRIDFVSFKLLIEKVRSVEDLIVVVSNKPIKYCKIFHGF